uniref:S1 motif domain-containing protein n=1 Tax=Chrysotila carterae TaxID=13221 RepID=A0A6S9VQY3_CHRCT
MWLGASFVLVVDQRREAIPAPSSILPQVYATAELLKDECSVPFIVRYRAANTGSLDETAVLRISKALQQQAQLQARCATIVKELTKQGVCTPALLSALHAARDLESLEDLYLPFKPPAKQCLAAKARELGFGPLAERVWSQQMRDAELDAALAAAHDAEEHVLNVLADKISASSNARASLREAFWRDARVELRLVKPEKKPKVASAPADAKGGANADGKEPKPAGKLHDYSSLDGLSSRPSEMSAHRVLAINRAEKEKAVKVVLTPPPQSLHIIFTEALPPRSGRRKALLEKAAESALKRLLLPSMRRAVRSRLTAQAEEAAISVFSRNLRQLLLQRPLRGTAIAGIDPGFRSGCKLVALDAAGRVRDSCVLFPHPPHGDREAARRRLRELLVAFGCTVVAIGNGTASRETQQFVCETLNGVSELSHVRLSVVSESGASVLSVSAASDNADDAHLDVGARGAASIARRLLDPLAELVKIEPKAIGVGMYQHDVSAKLLESELARVVQSCVCEVGVDINTASVALLKHVAGLNAARAAAIAAARPAHGFASRAELKKVKGIGAKSFEQAAGFLRVCGDAASEPLDSTAVHPESYKLAAAVLKHAKLSPADLCSDARRARLVSALTHARSDGGLASLSAAVGAPVETTREVLDALCAASRDARDTLDGPLLLGSQMCQLSDVSIGSRLRGVVRNVTPFGAFVDVGLKQDGLLHSSELERLPGEARPPEPHAVLRVGQTVTVSVVRVDIAKGQLSLSMRQGATPRCGTSAAQASAARGHAHSMAQPPTEAARQVKPTSQPTKRAGRDEPDAVRRTMAKRLP